MTRFLSVLVVFTLLITTTVFAGPGAGNNVVKSKTATQAYSLKNAKFFNESALWSVLQDSVPNPSIDQQFEHVDGNMRGMVLSFKEFVPMDEFLESFLSGMKEDAPETKYLDRRTATVNGVAMMEITIEMTTPQAPIRYIGYVYSGAKGVCMALGICHRDLFNDVKETLLTFAAGLVVETAAKTKTKTKSKK